MRHAALLSSLLAAAALAGCADAPLDQPMSGFGHAAKLAADQECDPPAAASPPVSSSGAHAAIGVVRYMQDRQRQPAGPNGSVPMEAGAGAGPSAAAGSSPTPGAN